MRYAYGLTTALLVGGATLSLITGLPAGAQVAQNDAARMSGVAPRAGAPASFADLVQQLQPAVVNIATRQSIKVPAGRDPMAGTPFEGMLPQANQGPPQTRQSGALGSGFLVSADGYVVTNNHVVTLDNQGVADKVTVILADGTEYNARIVGRDAQSDVAVLKIEAPRALPFVQFGQSGKARTGEWVVAIGNALGLGGTVTAGVISSVKRATGSGAYDHYIQTDASINSGNSGGPLFDMKGQVIGINNWIIASNGGGNIGIGFAIPSDVAAPIVERLRKGQAIDRGYLGVRIQPMNDDLADSLGLAHNKGELIQAVEPGKAGALAGIMPGDVVVRVNGKEVSPDQSLAFLVANIAPGSRVPLELIRGGQHLNVNATVGKRPTEEELAADSFGKEPQGGDPFASPASGGLAEKALGLSVLPLTPQIARQVGAPEGTKGLVLNAVDPGSDAGAKGLARGDVIVSANYKPVATPAELDAVIAAAKTTGRAAVLLSVIHQGQPVTYLPVRIR